ncbi:sugar phosphate isomerase/epimerase family protein [Kineococcus sp. SYSU DK004]|uniref:sugar phosphate isomerase/epimerase family protein n=1 Tax=Kineococcus sp. SYSU DK004 TaxID=3383125 RepID=UPI003D7DC620
MPQLHERIICSTISFRHQPLADALATITGLGFTGIDLGALPGVCDHVPYNLDHAAVRSVATTVATSGLTVRSVNADIGDLNEPLDDRRAADRREHLARLLDLCAATGATALVLPNGRQDHSPVRDLDSDLALVADQLTAAAEEASSRGLRLWVEAPHLFRLAHDVDRAAALYDRLPPGIGAVCDVSHIVASGSNPRRFLERFGDRTEHVHLRDASPGDIHHSIGRGDVDFADTVAALAETGYAGSLSLELETRDITHAERPAAALAAGEYISDLLRAHPTQENRP